MAQFQQKLNSKLEQSARSVFGESLFFRQGLV